MRGTGVEVTPHPLAPLAELAARNDPNSPLLAGQLTATYPRAFEPQLGREEIVNYPNQGARHCQPGLALSIFCDMQPARSCVSATKDGAVVLRLAEPASVLTVIRNASLWVKGSFEA